MRTVKNLQNMSSKISETHLPGPEIFSTGQAEPATSQTPEVRVFASTLAGIGAALFVWAVLEIGPSVGQDSAIGRFSLASAAGVAVAVFVSLAGTKWKAFAGWFGLALVGQAAGLQMIDAGRAIHFQHYRSFSELAQKDFLYSFLFLVQVLIVAAGILPRLGAVKDWLLARFAAWQLILAAALIVLSGAAVTPNSSIYATSLLIGTVAQLAAIANIVLLACAVPVKSLTGVQEKIDKFFGDAETEKAPRLDRFSLIAAVSVVVVTAGLSYFVYQAHPHVPDETQYVFQANYMAAGQMTVKPPLVPEAFAMYMVPTRENRWYGIFPPAWPAILAVGTLLGAGWAVNPFLSGLCVLLAYIFFQEAYSRGVARAAVLIFCCSPWLIFMGMSFMSHVSTLVFALAAAILLLRGIRHRNWIYALGAGVAVGVVGLIRPLDGAIVGALLCVAALVGNSFWTLRISMFAGLAAGTAALASLTLPYNKLVTGAAGLSPSDAYYNTYFWPKVMSLGFGPERGIHWDLDAFPGHSPFEALINGALNAYQLNTELFGWGIGSLLFVILLLVSGTVQKKDIWAWGSIAAIVIGYSFFWYHGGPDFGARYWFLCIVPLTALTVRGIEWLSGKVGRDERRLFDARVLLAVAVLCVTTVVIYIPWRSADKYFAYLGMQPGVRKLAEQFGPGKSLVLIQGNEHPDYQSAWIYNPLNFEGDGPIYAFDANAAVRAELLEKYGDRQVWIVEGPSITKDGYRIKQGPLDASEVPAKSAN